MTSRSKFTAVMQIILAVIGIAGLALTAYLCGSNISVVVAGGAAEFFGILIILPVQLLISGVTVIFGIITTSIALKQRHFDSEKDKFSLAMLIIGICLIVLPVMLDAAVFVSANLINNAPAEA